jgi:hydroxylamine dehydrogenase
MVVSKVKSLPIVLVALFSLLMAGSSAAIAGIPSETYKASNLNQETATPKQLYEALTKRYLNPKQGAEKGLTAKYRELIPTSAYLDPKSFYKPPKSRKSRFVA